MMDYWLDHADIALNEAGIQDATEAQIEIIAGVIESAHDFYGQAHGHDIASDNFKAEEERQRRKALTDLEESKDREIRDIEKALKQSRETRSRISLALQDARRELSAIKLKG
ncbi:MAG: hypothetical protein GY767_17805 [Shimia sp.]|nr:hypothetical protein [Shimia sp.]